MKGATIIGIDNINDYYDVRLKEYRLSELNKSVPKGTIWEFIKGDIADRGNIDDIFSKYKPAVVVNLAAQAGVRNSIENPDAYIQSNMIGFYSILETCLYNIPSTGLRFFTVYGPAGRPDMAYFTFTDKLLKGETIQLFNYGNCHRDFTYVDDIVEGIVRVMQGAPEHKKGEDGLPIPPYAIYNIGGGQPENLLDFVQILQEELVKAGVLPANFNFEAHKELVPMQPGDVTTTYADTTALEHDFAFTPKIKLREGLRKFAKWYKEYYC